MCASSIPATARPFIAPTSSPLTSSNTLGSLKWVAALTMARFSACSNLRRAESSRASDTFVVRDRRFRVAEVVSQPRICVFQSDEALVANQPPDSIYRNHCQTRVDSENLQQSQHKSSFAKENVEVSGHERDGRDPTYNHSPHRIFYRRTVCGVISPGCLSVLLFSPELKSPLREAGDDHEQDAQG